MYGTQDQAKLDLWEGGRGVELVPIGPRLRRGKPETVPSRYQVMIRNEITSGTRS